MKIGGRDIERVALIDDQAEVRNAYQFTVEEAELVPVPEGGPLSDLDASSNEITASTDAAICDQQLQLVEGYADFFGAELVASLYSRQFPALLCTKWDEAHIDRIRSFRRFIPVMMRPDELDPDSLVRGVEKCVREFEDDFSADRRPWRTQVHVVDVDEHGGVIFVELPSWSLDEIIRLRLTDLPESAREELRPGFRCHAHVNTGSEQNQDLYFECWETA